MYMSSFSCNVSKVRLLVRLFVRREIIPPTSGVSPPYFFSYVYTRFLLLFLLTLPLLWTCCLLVTDALFAVVVSVVSAYLSVGVVLLGILIFFPLQFSSMTRILHDFCSMTFPNSSMVATQLFLGRLIIFTKLPVDLYLPFVKKITVSLSFS